MNKQLYNADQVKTLYSISRATLYRRVSSGQIPKPIKINTRNYWSAAEVDEHVANIIGGVK